MKIHVNMVANTSTDQTTIELEDMGLTQEDWEEMDQGQKEDAINEYLSTLPEQPYWMVDGFEER